MNRDFMQMSKQMPKLMTKLLRKYPTALDIWLHLADCSNKYGACVVSQTEIKEAIGVKSRRTVYRAVKYLDDKNYLFIGRIGNQNVYIMNPKLVWKASDDETKNITDRIKFPSAIVLTKTENRKLFNEYEKFAKRCNRNVNLNKIRGPKRGHQNKGNHNHVSVNEKKDIKRGWTTNRKEAQRLHIGYQTKINFGSKNRQKTAQR